MMKIIGTNLGNGYTYGIDKDGIVKWSYKNDFWHDSMFTSEKSIRDDIRENPFDWELVEEPVETESDMVNHPEHYTAGGIETIDFIKAKLGTDGFIAYCAGNVLKYVSRYKHKNGLEDLKKAVVYFKWMVEAMEGGSDEHGKV